MNALCVNTKTARTACEQLGRMFCPTRKGLSMSVADSELSPCRKQTSTEDLRSKFLLPNGYAEGSTKPGKCLSGHCWLDAPSLGWRG